MQLFQNTNFDFLGKKWWFIAPTLVLLAAGAISLAMKGGPLYSIEFRGGAVLNVLWKGTPPVERIRDAVASRVKGASVVVAHDAAGSNEVLVSAQLPADRNLPLLRQNLQDALSTVSSEFSVRSMEMIGPEISGDLGHRALLAIGGASGGMLVYLAWRFRWGYGIAAVLAMIHDAFITIGLFSLMGQEISLTVVAALLTLIGYSMNDTIVVFDRVRENRQALRRESFAETVNRSINQTLSRTVLTSGLTLMSALSLLIFGGPVLHGFSLALVIGIIVGTFSSIFIASPILAAGEEAVRKWNASRVAIPAGGSR